MRRNPATAPAAGIAARRVPARRHPAPRRPVLGLAAILLVLAGGCARTPTVPTPPALAIGPDWTAERDRLAALQTFDLAGRVAVKTGNDGFSASLTWAQDGPHFRLTVTAALARQAVAIEGEPGRVTLTGMDGGPRTASDAETLMREALGWSVPLAGLRWWVRGIPDPAVPVDSLDAGPDGRPLRYTQAGWRIDIEERLDAGGYRLPGRLTLEREQARVRLVIRRWTTG